MAVADERPRSTVAVRRPQLGGTGRLAAKH